MDLFDYVNERTKLSEPYGWIQWKGTDVCMDLHCSCGFHSHIDTDFFYTFRCPDCKKIFSVGAYIKLIEIPQELMKDVNTDNIQEGSS